MNAPEVPSVVSVAPGTRVLVAMSGGVDSSVAAARLVDEGAEVVGVTMRLWGGESDTGCCSVSDVDDARRVADQLGIDHHVFNFADDFTAAVVEPYVAAHVEGRTPNPCIECNRHLKFDRLLRRADALGFARLATGHHARVVTGPAGDPQLWRGADPGKDQSYVLHVLGPDELARVVLPVGALTKAEVRAEAVRRGLRTAAKPDSQDVCFITSTGGRRRFLGQRVGLHPGRVVDEEGTEVGRVDAVELVTVGQRRGLGLGGAPDRRFVLAVDAAAATVVVGPPERLLDDQLEVVQVAWTGDDRRRAVTVQCRAHGEAHLATVDVVATASTDRSAPGERWLVRWAAPQRRVASGQSVVFYDGDRVLGGGVAA